MGVRASAAAIAMVAAALLPASPSGAAPVTPTVSVDLARPTGPVMHGANGSLYGPSDNGVRVDVELEPAVAK